MRLTSEIIHSAGSNGGDGFNSYQLKLLGVVWPPHPGWLKSLVDTDVNDVLWRAVLELKGVRDKKHRARILRSYGIDPVKLFQRPNSYVQKLLR